MLIEALLLWIGLDVFRWQSPKHWWVNISFFLYCTHSLVLEAVEKVFLLVLGKTLLGSVLDLLIAPLLTLVLLILAAWLLRKFTPRFWKLINGGRG